MIDTSNKIREIYHNMLMSKTGEERFLMGISMFESAKKVMLASFPDNISAQQKKIMYLNRIYGADFKEGKIKDIVCYLTKGRK